MDNDVALNASSEIQPSTGEASLQRCRDIAAHLVTSIKELDYLRKEGYHRNTWSTLWSKDEMKKAGRQLKMMGEFVLCAFSAMSILAGMSGMLNGYILRGFFVTALGIVAAFFGKRIIKEYKEYRKSLIDNDPLMATQEEIDNIIKTDWKNVLAALTEIAHNDREFRRSHADEINELLALNDELFKYTTKGQQLAQLKTISKFAVGAAVVGVGVIGGVSGKLGKDMFK